jgi:hypothetical protein
MRTNPDFERDEPLLVAMLADEDWQAANAGFKAAAMRTFRVRQRVRRLTRWAGSVVALAAVIAGSVHWFRARPAAPPPVMVAHLASPKALASGRGLTDTELVAAFPKGSCFIAEVDGKKRLIFLDPEVERTCVAPAAQQGE